MPLNAVVREAGASSQFAVMVVDGGVAQQRPVVLGATYGDRIAVEGVEAGIKVVNSGAAFVRDGDAVKVVP